MRDHGEDSCGLHLQILFPRYWYPLCHRLHFRLIPSASSKMIALHVTFFVHVLLKQSTWKIHRQAFLKGSSASKPSSCIRITLSWEVQAAMRCNNMPSHSITADIGRNFWHAASIHVNGTRLFLSICAAEPLSQILYSVSGSCSLQTCRLRGSPRGSPVCMQKPLMTRWKTTPL